MIYEMRVYEAMPGKMAELHKLIDETAFPAHARVGMKVVAYLTSVIGPTNNQIIHILAYESLAEREKQWAAFQADDGWRKGLASGGPLVAKISNSIWQPTAYSPVPQGTSRK